MPLSSSMPTRAPIALVRGSLKVFVNDAAMLGTVLRELDRQPPASSQLALACLAVASDTIMQAAGTRLPHRVRSLRDVLYHLKQNQLLDSTTIRQVEGLHMAYSYLRHTTSSETQALADRVAAALLATTWSAAPTVICANTKTGDSCTAGGCLITEKSDLDSEGFNTVKGDSDSVGSSVTVHIGNLAGLNSVKGDLDSVGGSSVTLHHAAQEGLISVEGDSHPGGSPVTLPIAAHARINTEKGDFDEEEEAEEFVSKVEELEEDVDVEMLSSAAVIAAQPAGAGPVLEGVQTAQLDDLFDTFWERQRQFVALMTEL
eukprot:CAMPEP_0183521062 /NCGR_PEP_ID=MMETSP0371-20130417/17395_1 /TAXON_ID=268820 /ORGANISM="Peridinium aciculiferum, Strain PAER-2" /LENGTH=315 /DNA_ID=CAMNT_0025719541 /DNA_START=65 /DNA_END=1012 /DNA_ORIENTATION=-